MRHRLLSGFLLLLWATGASGATFIVTKETDDDGPCTLDDCALREAVLAANALPGADVIEIPGGTYQLSLVGPVPEDIGMTGDIDIIDDLEIRGDPLKEVTVIGDGTDRVLHALRNSVVEMSHLVITGGASPSGGGGMRITGSGFTLRDSTVTGNTAVGFGGGIQVAADTVTIERCLIDGNSAAQKGGGLYMFLPSVFQFAHIINSTITNNRSSSGGGAYLVSTAFYTITNSTFADNEGDGRFSDALVADGTNRLTLSNSLFLNNECGYISAIPNSNGHNMEGPTATCFVPGSGDQMGIPDLFLGPLADNGGPTRTRALLAGSPAIDAALDSDCPATDQRGRPRPTDGDFDKVPRCDVGAFESEGLSASDVPAVGGLGLGVLAVVLALGGWRLLRRRA